MLFTNKKWILPEYDNDLIDHISNKFNINKITASIICNRGYTNDEDIENYIHTDSSMFYNPFLLKGMQEGVDFVISAIKNKVKIAIYGDYDVDGITSTYILYDYLNSIKADVVYYIPDRIEEGYGLNKNAIDKLADENIGLIITVDVGITAINEVEYAKSKNINVIITDHHTPQEMLPKAITVINPKIDECNYPNKNLAGVGVAYKFVYALSNCNDEIMKKYSSAACIGTIADMVPLTDENRYIATLGLNSLKANNNLGLEYLMEVSGIDKTQISSSNISFGIAPRLNAAGRIASAKSSVELFLTTDQNEAKNIATYLDDGNKARQNEETFIADEAFKIIENNKLYEDNVIVVAQKNWHHGIIGIVSSKITEKYYKPSCIISIGDNNVAKASGRSISGFNLFNALAYSEDTLLKYGGHELAAGFSLETQNIEKFRKKINEYADSIMTDDILTPKIKIDSEISIKDLSPKLANELKILEPHGTGNRTPVLMLKNTLVNNIKLNKTHKHSFLTLSDSNYFVDTPCFNMPEIPELYHPGDKINIVGNININTYKGSENVQIFVKDIKTAESSKYSVENLRCVFVCIKDYMERDLKSVRLYELSSMLRTRYNLNFNNNRLTNSIKVFNELDITDCNIIDGVVYLKKGKNFFVKCKIDNSDLYNTLNERTN